MRASPALLIAGPYVISQTRDATDKALLLKKAEGLSGCLPG